MLKVHQAKLGETFGHYIFGKVSRIPYFCLEDPECLDLLERARFNVTNENCIRAVLTGLANIVQYVLTLISLAAFLAAFDYRLFGILLIAVFLNIILFRFFFEGEIGVFGRQCGYQQEIRVLYEYVVGL